MRAVLEFSTFLGLAAVAHLAVWQAGPEGARPGAGASGPDTVSLAGADAALDMLVATWDSPPVVAPAPVAAAAPPVADSAPTLPVPDRAPAPAMPSTPVQPDLPMPAPDLPQVDLSVPAPPASPLAPLRALRPPERPEPRQAPQPSRAAPPAQVARGEGRQETAAADTAPAATGTAAAAPDPGLMAQWGGAIRASIERRKRYPYGTRASGTVTLTLVVTTGGALAQVGLAGSAGDPALDRAAIDAVQRASLPRAPAGIATGQHRFTLSMAFAP